MGHARSVNIRANPTNTPATPLPLPLIHYIPSSTIHKHTQRYPKDKRERGEREKRGRKREKEERPHESCGVLGWEK